MSSPEEYIKKTFDEITMPQGLKESTLDMVEKRAQEIGAPSGTRAARRTKSLAGRIGFAIAACLVFLAVGIFGFTAYTTETAVVGIEVNPSIELGVNRFDMVIDARALNEDGEYVLGTVSIIGKPYRDAVDTIVQSDAFLSYVGEDSFVDMFVVCPDNDQSSTLVDQGRESISALPCDGICDWVSPEHRNEAAQQGMGVGRYEAAQVLLSLDPSLTIEDCTSMSMNELRKHITEHDPSNEYASGHGNQGQGHANGAGSGKGQQRQDPGKHNSE